MSTNKINPDLTGLLFSFDLECPENWHSYFSIIFRNI